MKTGVVIVASRMERAGEQVLAVVVGQFLIVGQVTIARVEALG